MAAFVGITEANLSLLEQGKVKGVRFATLARICTFLDCQTGDLLAHVADDAPDRAVGYPGRPADGTPG